MSNYPIKNDPTTADQCLIWDVANNTWKRMPISDLFSLYNESQTGTVLEADSQYNTPLTGGTVLIDVSDNDTHLILTPAGTIAALTVTLPAAVNLRDKQIILVTCTQQITALTVSGNGVTINGAPTSMGADDYFTLKYDLTLGTWNRIG